MPKSVGISARELRRALVDGTFQRVLAAAAVGALVWGPFLYVMPRIWAWPERPALLLVVMANQAGCLVVGLAHGARAKDSYFHFAIPELDFQESSTKTCRWHALVYGILGTGLAIVLGVIYDMLVRSLMGTDAPTIGAYGALRQVHPFASGLIMAVVVSLAPFGDEIFFRAGIFRAWANDGAPRAGALVSSILFAVSRLDVGNFPAYIGLGLLLCALYRYSGSLLAPLTTHVLNNAFMLMLLFSGYQ